MWHVWGAYASPICLGDKTFVVREGIGRLESAEQRWIVVAREEKGGERRKRHERGGDFCAELMAGRWCLSQVSLRWNGGGM